MVSPLSAVDPQAVIADSVEIGPFCYVGPHVTIGPGSKLKSHVAVFGQTTIGRDNVFWPHCVIGSDPQDKKYRGSLTSLVIGDGNDIRESVTIHTGTEKGGMVTRVGNNNLLMINCHLGHDAQIGNNCILANNVMIAGHVNCGNYVNIMAAVGVHHFVTIDDYAYLSGLARIHHDVPPYVKVDGADQVRGLNKVGLRRAGFCEEDIEALDKAVRRLFFKEKPLAVAMREFELENGVNPHVKRLLEFLQRRSQGRHGRYLESLRPGTPGPN